MNLDYLAGIVDGEGTVGLTIRRKKNEIQPYIAIANTVKSLMDEIGKFYTENNLTWCISTKQPRKKEHRVSYTITVKGRDAIRLASLLKNRLMIKSVQAGLLVDEYASCTPRNGKYSELQRITKQALVHRMQVLNSRGV